MSTKKSTSAQEDMHPADVIAALHKRGTSLRKIAIENGYSHIQRVLTSPWLAAEQLVAKALDKKPEDLWPSRYVNPANRALAFQQTRKIAVTMPHQRKQKPPKISADRIGHSWSEPEVNHE
ncbi:MAG: transcriptional regulator [Burkholderiales bacterium RIFCSPHIGHO2_12_FULL_61_11]|nr:MAG: transcriptional regulator [Burkholderiales bacterium RIFCSPHIGHO2_12_FULL_61_11]